MGQFSAPENGAETAPIFWHVGIDFSNKGGQEIFKSAKPRAQKMGLKMSQKMGSKLAPFLVSSGLAFKPAAAWLGSRAWGAGGPSMASVCI